MVSLCTTRPCESPLHPDATRPLRPPTSKVKAQTQDTGTRTPTNEQARDTVTVSDVRLLS